MTVGRMLSEMSAAEFADWQTFYSHEADEASAQAQQSRAREIAVSMSHKNRY